MWCVKYINKIDPSHKSQNASVPYPTMQHFVTEMCTCVHISVTKWCIVGYLSDAFWDLWDGSIAERPLIRQTGHMPAWLSFPNTTAEYVTTVNTVSAFERVQQLWYLNSQKHIAYITTTSKGRADYQKYLTKPDRIDKWSNVFRHARNMLCHRKAYCTASLHDPSHLYTQHVRPLDTLVD